MAAITPPVPTQAVTLPSLPTPPKTFLGRCIEDLDPKKITALENSSFWKNTAGKVLLIAFVLLAAAACFALGLLAPVYVPIFVFAIVPLALPFAHFVKTQFLDVAEKEKAEMLQYEAIQKNHSTLLEQSEKAQETFKKVFTDRGIEQPEATLKTLTPLLAQAQYFDAEIQKLARYRDAAVKEANQLEIPTAFEKERAHIHALRTEALAVEDMILQAKMRAAFINAVMRKPDTVGSLEEVATLCPLKQEERLFKSAVNDDALSPFVVFLSKKDKISIQETLEWSIAELGERVFKAMQVA